MNARIKAHDRAVRRTPAHRSARRRAPRPRRPGPRTAASAGVPPATSRARSRRVPTSVMPSAGLLRARSRTLETATRMAARLPAATRDRSPAGRPRRDRARAAAPSPASAFCVLGDQVDAALERSARVREHQAQVIRPGLRPRELVLGDHVQRRDRVAPRGSGMRSPSRSGDRPSARDARDRRELGGADRRTEPGHGAPGAPGSPASSSRVQAWISRSSAVNSSRA